MDELDHKHPIPDLLGNLFHNYKTVTIDLKRDDKAVILTILIGGSWQQIQWAVAYYGLGRIGEVVQADLTGWRTLPPITANFWSVVLWGKQLAPMTLAERWGMTRTIREGGVDALE